MVTMEDDGDDDASSHSSQLLVFREKHDAHRLLRAIFFRYLQLNPPDRRVVLCQSVLAADAVRDAVSRALLERLRAPSLTVVPAEVAAAVARDCDTALVVDVGAHETRCVPVIERNTLVPHARASPRSVGAVTAQLRTLLLSMARVVVDDDATRDVQPADLSHALLDELRRAYCTRRGARDGDVEHVAGDALRLRIPRVVFCEARKALMEDDDDDDDDDDDVLEEAETSLVALCLRVVAACPRDYRAALLHSIVVCGGGSDHGAFADLSQRLAERLRARLRCRRSGDAASDADELRALAACVRVAPSTAPFASPSLAFVGASICASLPASTFSSTRTSV